MRCTHTGGARWRCPADAVEGRTRCEKHLEAIRRCQNARRAQRAILGLCRDCRRKAARNRTLCRRHLTIRAAASKRHADQKRGLTLVRESNESPDRVNGQG